MNQQNNTAETIDELAELIHNNAVSKGFWDASGDIPHSTMIGMQLLYIHEEVSEAVQAIKKGEPEELPVELADILIRTLDLFVGAGYDNPSDYILKKVEYNATRPKHHGKKLL